MGITLYHFPPSGPSRGALLSAKSVGIDVDVQIIDLFKNEQLKEDFIKVNPQHTVPTLVDGDLSIWDSHAIAAYLATAYGKDDSLYPKDPKRRAVIDQRLNFDCGTLYPRIRAICAVGWDITPYANVAAWVSRCSLAIPGYAEANQVGADAFGKAVRSKLAPGQL
ncbi:hypothetical protein NQ314_008306 [Rhamnusium bicolor]|uniref:GST N-terminal domain-containing protein n=1 Tax=Rhamnusium bicolor TaxID=1586634 RepID=A0AAV8YEU4_9CUCU|nr:hypothetical protein NQ314_008306 [Rhamnusium bicolor]